MSLKKENKVFGFITMVIQLTSLVLITCTCSGPRLMLGQPILGNQTDYSSYSGKLVKQTRGVMECRISRTDVQDFHSWRLGRQLTWQRYQRIHGLGYCPNLAPMLRKCSQIRLYPSLLTTRSSSNQYKTEWIAQKRSSLIEYPHQGSPDVNLTKVKPRRS